MSTRRWAVCAAGKIGFIESQNGDLCKGTSITGRPWQTKVPQMIHPQHAAHLDRIFEGRKS